MSSEFGRRVRVSVFGESHGEAIGAVISGLPAGEKIDMEELAAFMERRAPGGRLVSPRKETDEICFLSGVKGGVIEGTPICLVIRNENADAAAYDALCGVPRPGHADYTAFVKYRGYADMRGGGHFSGRLTAPICAAGGIAMQILRRRFGVNVGAHLLSVGEIRDASFDPVRVCAGDFEAVRGRTLPVVNQDIIPQISEKIAALADIGDSVGARVECAVTGLSAGLGGPLFGGIEGLMAGAIFAIPAVKAVSFGAALSSCAEAVGSEFNDAYSSTENGKIVTETNNCGGLLGGITTGMPVIFTAELKPTPTVRVPQRSVRPDSGEAVTIEAGGRHDPCIGIRAVPVVEAVAALVCLDLLMEGNNTWN